MLYYLIERVHPGDDDNATDIYLELDDGRKECRRIEFYPNGLCFSYGDERGGEEVLAPDPLPDDLRELYGEEDFQVHSIPPRTFYEMWNQTSERPIGFMDLFF